MNTERWYSDTENRYRGYRIDIDTDEYPPDPREDSEPMGKMICFHRRYDLGDKHSYHSPETLMQELAEEVYPNLGRWINYQENEGYYRLKEKNPDAGEPEITKTIISKIRKVVNRIIDRKYLILELYLYDHSGLTMRTAPFSCPWDSGQVGIICMTKEQAYHEYGEKDKADSERRALDYMRGEVKTYDAYLRGDVFGWQLYDPEDEFIDSCFGYYGFFENIEYVMSEVKAIVDGIYQRQEDEAAAEAYEKQQEPARRAVCAAQRFRKGATYDTCI